MDTCKGTRTLAPVYLDITILRAVSVRVCCTLRSVYRCALLPCCLARREAPQPCANPSLMRRPLPLKSGASESREGQTPPACCHAPCLGYTSQLHPRLPNPFASPFKLLPSVLLWMNSILIIIFISPGPRSWLRNITPSVSRRSKQPPQQPSKESMHEHKRV